MSEQPVKERFLSLRSILTILGIFVVLGLAGISGGIGKEVARSVFKNSTFLNSAPRYSEKAWKRTSIRSISIETPFAFKRASSVNHYISKETRKLIEIYESYQGKSSNRRLSVALSYCIYKVGTRVDLDGSVRGAIASISGALGLSIPEYSVDKFAIDGVEARKAHFQASVEGQAIQVVVIVLAQSRTHWVLVVTDVNDSTHAAAQRVINSIRVLP